MTIRLILVSTAVATVVAGGAVTVIATAAEETRRRIEGHGLGLEVPPGWDGYVSRASGRSAPQLVAANFELPPDDGSILGQRLPDGGIRLIVWDYGRPLSPPPTESVPAIRRADLGGFEGVPQEHTTGSYSFVTGGRNLQVLATFAAEPSDELIAEANEVLGTLEVGSLDERAPPTAERDALWLQLVHVAAGFRSLAELDWNHQWNLALPTGGPNSIHVWFTHARREPEGVVDDDGVRASWGAQGLTLWAEPVGNWELRRTDLRRLVAASLRVPRR